MFNRRSVLKLLPASLFVMVAAPVSAQQARGITLEDLRRAFERRDSGFRRAAQAGLQSEGYYRGRLDGAWGPGTASGYKKLLESDRYRRASRDWNMTRAEQIDSTLTFLSVKEKHQKRSTRKN